MKLKTKIALWIITPIFIIILLAILLMTVAFWIFIKMLQLLGILDALIFLLEYTKKKLHEIYFRRLLNKEDREMMKD